MNEQYDYSADNLKIFFYLYKYIQCTFRRNRRCSRQFDLLCSDYKYTVSLISVLISPIFG
jgi:hypothetical protein